jgi:Dynamin family
MTSAQANLGAPGRGDAHRAVPGTAFTAGHDASLEFAEFVRKARHRLEKTGDGLARLTPALRALKHIEAQLVRPLRLAILGEFNSGKSTLVNLMVGNAPLPTLQISNTRIPTLLHYAPSPVVSAALRGGVSRVLTTTSEMPAETIRIRVGMPMPYLRACEIVDFPGFADPWLSYGALDIARHPVDAAIWCTFSTQAWKESESTAWRILPARIRANSLLAVTNKDLLAGDQMAKLMARIRKAAGGDFKEIALISALEARKGLSDRGEIGDPALWRASGAESFYGGVQRLLSAIRQHRLEKAKALTSKIAGSALKLLGS